MASAAIAVRRANRHSAVVDRFARRVSTGNGRDSGGASVEVGRVGPLLPEPASTNSPEEIEAEVTL